MARTTALLGKIDTLAAARSIIVSACAAALIAAGSFLPFG
mgnify:CR=1 FL=1